MNLEFSVDHIYEKVLITDRLKKRVNALMHCLDTSDFFLRIKKLENISYPFLIEILQKNLPLVHYLSN